MYIQYSEGNKANLLTESLWYVHDDDEVEGKKFDIASSRGTKRGKSIKAQYVHLISFIVCEAPLLWMELIRLKELGWIKESYPVQWGSKRLNSFVMCVLKSCIRNLRKKSFTSYSL